MDPKETLILLLLALAKNERAEAQDYADALADWLSKDGFTPKIDSQFIDDLQSRLQPVLPPLHVVVQLGGSSTEWYPGSYDSRSEALAAIVGHYDASYSAIGPFELPNPPDEGDWLDLLGEVAAAAATRDMADYDTIKQELGIDEEEDGEESSEEDGD